ncbi:MAG: ABC transporter permease [Planctomycetota bacterium]
MPATVYTIALKLLTGDRIKYLGCVFGVAFSTLLLGQQITIFIGLLALSASGVNTVRDADIWVSDPRVQYIDEGEPLRDVELYRVRSVPSVEWAAPFFVDRGTLRSPDLDRAYLVEIRGLDDATLAGAPVEMVMGNLEDVRNPETVLINASGYQLIWPGEDYELGRVVEINERRVKIVGICEIPSTFLADKIFYATYSTAVNLAPGQRNRLSYVIADPVDGRDPAEVAKEIEAATGLQALTRDAFADRSIRFVLENTGIPVSFGAVIIMGAVVGIAIVSLTFYQFVSDNLRQFAALKAVGVTNWQIIRMVFVQATLIEIVGFGLGVGGAALFFYAGQDSPDLKYFIFRWQVVLGIFVAITLIMLLSIVTSIRRVLVLDPAVVFRG